MVVPVTEIGRTKAGGVRGNGVERNQEVQNGHVNFPVRYPSKEVAEEILLLI